MMPAPQVTGSPERASLNRFVLAGAVSSLLVLATAVALAPRVRLPATGRASTAVWLGLAWLAFAVGAWLIGRLAHRAAVVLIVVGGLALPLLAGFTPPHSSDDMYRYLWDGRVQAAGVDPYRYPPAARELTRLRDGYLWPDGGAWCVSTDHVDGGTDAGMGGGTDGGPDAGTAAGVDLVPGCTRINRPGVPTIYPPVAEALFVAVHAVSPAGAGYLPWQLFGAACALATTVLLLLGLSSLRLDPRRAVLWAWCPVVAVEAGNNAHIDVAAAFLAGAGMLALARSVSVRRTVLGGVLIGLAIACKVTPVLVMPAVLRRRSFAVLGAAVGAVAVVYLPHLLAVGAGVIGYVPGYLHEEGYADGTRFALLTWLVPSRWAAGPSAPTAGSVATVLIPAVAALIVAVAAVVLFAADPDRPWRGAAAMTGVALLVTTPSYPWYAMLLVLCVAWGGRATWLTVAVAGYLAQYAGNLSLPTVVAQRLGYGLAGLVVAVGWLWHRYRTGLPRLTQMGSTVSSATEGPTTAGGSATTGGSAKTGGSGTTEPARGATADRHRD